MFARIRGAMSGTNPEEPATPPAVESDGTPAAAPPSPLTLEQRAAAIAAAAKERAFSVYRRLLWKAVKFGDDALTDADISALLDAERTLESTPEQRQADLTFLREHLRDETRAKRDMAENKDPFQKSFDEAKRLRAEIFPLQKKLEAAVQNAAYYGSTVETSQRELKRMEEQRRQHAALFEEN